MSKFEKGISGNPGGRPGGLGRIRDIAQQHTENAIETLVRILNSETASPSAQVAAASALLDRGYGRPEQSLRASVGQIDLGEALQKMSERIQMEKVPEKVVSPDLASVPLLAS